MRPFVRATASGRLERWLGTETVEGLSRAMRGWHGPPIALAGVPGAVWACGDGDFRGPIACGQHSHALDFAEQRLRRIWRGFSRRQAGALGSGFASISDLVSEALSAGKRNVYAFYKAPTLSFNDVGDVRSFWGLGPFPPAGANASAAPGGNAPTAATTGAIGLRNPTSPDTQHLAGWQVTGNAALWNLLLYDRLFQVDKTMNSTATEAVTGVPSRYQNQTATAADYIGGNFLFVEVGGTDLAATAHNWTVCTYTDQAGAASTLPSAAGISAQQSNELDSAANQWFAPLESGDVGVKALTQMQCSALVLTGVINFVIGHPLAWMPCPLANVVCQMEGIGSAFSLVRIFDDAALAFLQVSMVATDSDVTIRGNLRTVSG